MVSVSPDIDPAVLRSLMLHQAMSPRPLKLKCSERLADELYKVVNASNYGPPLSVTGTATYSISYDQESMAFILSLEKTDSPTDEASSTSLAITLDIVA